MRGKRQTDRQREGERERERESREKINAEMLLQKLSPPNHVILLYRGDAEALLDRVSHSSPGAAGVGRTLRANVERGTLNFPQRSNFKLVTSKPVCVCLKNHRDRSPRIFLFRLLSADYPPSPQRWNLHRPVLSHASVRSRRAHAAHLAVYTTGWDETPHR